MTIKRQSLPTPKLCVRPKRFTEFSTWRAIDLSVNTSNNIAISGFEDETGQTFIEVFSDKHSQRFLEYRQNLKLHYSREFTRYSDYYWRYITFLEHPEEIACSIGDKLEVLDIEEDIVLRDNIANGEITSLCFKNGKIFTGVGLSNEVKVYDENLHQIKSVQLKGLQDKDFPSDISAISDKLFVCLHDEWKSLSFNAANGEMLTEFGQVSRTVEDLEPYSLAINEDLNLVSVLYWDEICLFTLHDGECFLSADVGPDNSRIRISNEGCILTCDYYRGDVNVYDLAEIFTYNNLKEYLALTLQKYECIQLAKYFAIPTETIGTSGTFTDMCFVALEEKNILQPYDVERFNDALVELKINPSCIAVANIFQESRILPTTYERFLVSLSAHLTTSLSEHLYMTFSIPNQEKAKITTSKNANLSLLLSLDEMGIIGPLQVAPLLQPFQTFDLVQAVATIFGYQKTVEDQSTDFHRDTLLAVGGKEAQFIKYLQKRIKSWYETMSPVPWMKSCKWKSTDLFVTSRLFFSDSKTKANLVDIDDQCKIECSEIFTHERLKDEYRIILEGEPGSGKTMLMSQLAYDWCEGKFRSIKMLILLPLKFVKHKTVAASIKDFYCPDDDRFSVYDINGFLEDSKNPVYLLLDGLEEYTGATHAGKQSEIVQIMSKVKYPHCKTVISSRSDYAPNLQECPVLKLGKFGKAEMDLYFKKALLYTEDEYFEMDRFINDSSFILDLCSVPLLFVMTVHNLKHMSRLQMDKLDTVAPFMKSIIEILCSEMTPTVNSGTDYWQNKGVVHSDEVEHHGSVQAVSPAQSTNVEQIDNTVLQTLSHQPIDLKTQEYLTNITSDIDDHLLTIEELAFNGLCRGIQQLSWQRDFVEKNVKNSRKWISSGILIVAEVTTTSNSIKTFPGQYSSVPESRNRPSHSNVSESSDSFQISPSLEDQGNYNGDVPIETPHGALQGNNTGSRHVYEHFTEDTPHENKQGAWNELSEVDLRIESDSEKTMLVNKTEATTKKEDALNSDDDELPTHIDGTIVTTNEVKILNKVSLQVKFLHKLIQEWFAANHFSSMLWKFKSLTNLQECIDKHLPYILPSDLHYILRFTCFLCPQSFYFIGKHLLQMYKSAVMENREHIMDCIFLCFVEYKGEHGADLFEFVAELCQESINVRSRDSRLLQQAKYGVMELASQHWIPIREVVLNSIVVSAKEDFITFNSGITMSPLNTLEILEISRWDQLLKDEEFPCIVKFISQCYSLREARFYFPHQPPQVDTHTRNILLTESIKVTWIIGAKLSHTFDTGSGTWVFSPPLEYPLGNITRQHNTANIFTIQGKISQHGGKMQIPDTDVTLKFPADALTDENKDCVIRMRILPPHSHEKYYSSFSSNSTVAVELLPNNMKLRNPVQLTLPHCLKLKNGVQCKAKILMSHHERNDDIYWEEVADQRYMLNDTSCTIWLNKFCWVKYEIDDKVVEAKKIKIFTAARPLWVPDNIAEVEVGYYLDLPAHGEFLQQNPDFLLGQRKSFLFHKEGKYPMKVELQRVIPNSWHHSAPEENIKEIPFQTVASSVEYSCPFVLEQVTKGCDIPICTFMASQEGRSLQLNVRPEHSSLRGRSRRNQSTEAYHSTFGTGHSVSDFAHVLQPNRHEAHQQEMESRLPMIRGRTSVEHGIDVSTTIRKEEFKARKDKMRDIFLFLKRNLTTDWRDFGRYLNVPEAELSRLVRDNKDDIRESTYQMLLYWERTNASEAATEKLLHALEKMDRKDLIERITEIWN